MGQEKHSLLESAAADIDDLLSPIVTIITPTEKRKIVNTAKAADLPSDFADDPAVKRLILAAVTAAMATKSHPPGADRGNKRAKGPSFSQAKLDQLALEECMNFNRGTCEFGDSCHRKHVPAHPACLAAERTAAPEEGMCYVQSQRNLYLRRQMSFLS